MHDVRIMKLVSGEEIICDVVEENDDTFMVKNPYGMTIAQDGSGIMFYPWTVAHLLSTNDNEYKLNCSGIVMVTKASGKLEREYTAKVSNIVVPSQADAKKLLVD